MNLKKLVLQGIFSISYLSLFSLSALSSTNPNSNSNGRYGMELKYFESAYQCGAGEIDIDVKVYKNNELFVTMVKGDALLLDDVDSLNDLSFEYYSPDCSFNANDNRVLGPQDIVPDLAGAYSQVSIRDMLNSLDSYEELYLVELGTDNTASQYYDLQDVVLVVNHNPNRPPVANNDDITTSIFNSIITDVLSNDTDEDGDKLTLVGINAVFSGGNAAIKDNKIVYTAGAVPGGFSMTYTVKDEYGETSQGSVNITVTASPD